jgi:hypothetical protein
MKMRHLLILTLYSLTAFLSADTDKFLFCYKFRPGEDLIYRTNRQDSIVVGTPSKATTREVNIHLLQTLSVHPSSLSVDHSLSYQMDSVRVTPDWTSPLLADWDLVRCSPAQSPDSLIHISTNGYPLSKPSHFQYTLLTLPLSEFPLELNDGWEFEFEVQEGNAGAFLGKSVVFGHGILYDFIRENDSPLARFVVTTTRLFDGECQLSDDSKTMAFDRKGEISATHLVYFDEERGVITRIITDQVTKEQRHTASGFVTLTVKSKSTTELMSL